MGNGTRYQEIIKQIFLSKHKTGNSEVLFTRADIEKAANELGIKLPKNLGDLIYSFRYRTPLPEEIQKRAPRGKEWIIRPAGRGKYRFVAAKLARIEPSKLLAETKIPDSTPGVISMYALSDEQALLAIIRYNRLIDIFTRVACYSLQSHLRTTVRMIGQVETDEIYIGVDRGGAHYVFPGQAKGEEDSLNVVQIEQDIAMCKQKLPALICRPVAAQFLSYDLIVMSELEERKANVAVLSEKHYRLVPPDEIEPGDVEAYKARSLQTADNG